MRRRNSRCASLVSSNIQGPFLPYRASGPFLPSLSHHVPLNALRFIPRKVLLSCMASLHGSRTSSSRSCLQTHTLLFSLWSILVIVLDLTPPYPRLTSLFPSPILIVVELCPSSVFRHRFPQPVCNLFELCHLYLYRINW